MWDWWKKNIESILTTAQAAEVETDYADEAGNRLSYHWNKGKPYCRITGDDLNVEIDLSQQVISLETKPTETDQPWNNFFAKLPLNQAKKFVSAALLGFKAKQFDDGLYAAVELALQEGAGAWVGKRVWMGSIAPMMARHPEAATNGILRLWLAACALGGQRIPASAATTEAVKKLIADFQHDHNRSKPVGFYPWSNELCCIFQQDRLLQTPLRDVESAAPLLQLFRNDARLHESYDRYLQLLARLTNPFVLPDLRAVLNGKVHAREPFAIFPPSRSHEVTLGERLFKSKPIPPDFDLMEELISQVITGKLSLAPQEDSGWYDLQTWAHGPFLLPEQTEEASRLSFHRSYKLHLRELFKGLQALARETHAKQLLCGRLGASPQRLPFPFFSALTVEPVATYYNRRAEGYVFLREVLCEFFGESALHQLRRLTASGPLSESLLTELDAMIALFRGAAATVRIELGMPPEPNDEATFPVFRRWVKRLDSDADLQQDPRMMVPVFFDIERQKLKVWAVLGWTTKTLKLDFAQKPSAEIVSESYSSVEFIGGQRELVQPVFVETYVDRLLNRDEFRQICDRYTTPEQITRALSSVTSSNQ